MHRWGVHRQVVQLLHVGTGTTVSSWFPAQIQFANWKLDKKVGDNKKKSDFVGFHDIDILEYTRSLWAATVSFCAYNGYMTVSFSCYGAGQLPFTYVLRILGVSRLRRCRRNHLSRRLQNLGWFASHPTIALAWNSLDLIRTACSQLFHRKRQYFSCTSQQRNRRDSSQLFADHGRARSFTNAAHAGQQDYMLVITLTHTHTPPRPRASGAFCRPWRL